MMSRTKWYYRPNRAYAMGICLHHRRPILYDEGRAKGCVSRRRCKWFRGPNEGTPAEVMEATSCPAEEEEEEEWEEEDDKGQLHYQRDTLSAGDGHSSQIPLFAPQMPL